MRYPRRRPAFTLIELLVVIGLIVVLASITALVVPPLAGDYNRVRAVDLLSEWLLSAKQRARRDQVPTGIRLQTDASGLYSQVLYVQQPDALSGAQLGGTCNGTGGTASATVTFTGVDFTGGGTVSGTGQVLQGLVQPGDYLQVATDSSGQPVHKVIGVSLSAGTYTVTLATATLNVLGPTSSYSFYRQPRPLVGEEVKQLPGTVAINNALSLNIPTNTTGSYEIVFGPTGAVVGYGTTGGKIVLFLQDYATDTNPGPPTLIAIQTRTGFIGAFPVAPGANPYAFAEDGRSSGF
jgi:prepilin-type N-terminal cleavage/methylation domain-containing protein